jgi:hypothetical protein
MRFTGFSFMNNSKLLVFANQPVAAGANSNWQSKAAIANLDGSSFVDISQDESADARGEDRIIGFSLFNRLPKEENVVLMEIRRFSGTEIVRLNVNTGRQDRFARTGDNESFEWADSDGNIKIKTQLKASNGVYTNHVYFREINDTAWRELPGLAFKVNDRYNLSPHSSLARVPSERRLPERLRRGGVRRPVHPPNQTANEACQNCSRCFRFARHGAPPSSWLARGRCCVRGALSSRIGDSPRHPRRAFMNCICPPSGHHFLSGGSRWLRKYAAGRGWRTIRNHLPREPA